jgi:putative SOS response-associated peptidase YedK
MCGRTALTTSPEDLREAFGLAETPQLVPHYNVPPSQPVAVVRVLRHDRSRPPAAAGARTMDLLRWGLVPAWAKDIKLGHKLSLARVETAATTPAFRDALRRRRCLVVVDGFYEWKRSAASARVRSQPFFVFRADRAPFALAGLWERWVSSDGEVVESCAILTQPARAPVDAVHDRMPLVVERGLGSLARSGHHRSRRHRADAPPAVARARPDGRQPARQRPSPRRPGLHEARGARPGEPLLGVANAALRVH